MNGHGCHCLCVVNHKTVVGCCSGMATTTVKFKDRDIPMCRNCATATETARAARRAA